MDELELFVGFPTIKQIMKYTGKSYSSAYRFVSELTKKRLVNCYKGRINVYCLTGRGWEEYSKTDAYKNNPIRKKVEAAMLG